MTAGPGSGADGPGPADRAPGDRAPGGGVSPGGGAGAVLGIDIGGSSLKAAPVEVASGRLLAERVQLATPRPASPAALAATVAELTRHFTWTAPVGCTFPGVVKAGRTMTATHLDPAWVGLAADRLFSEATGCPVTVMNDADAAGVAELRVGAGTGRSDLVLVLTLGTGIGSALFWEGRLVPNTEFGLLPIRGRSAEDRAAARIRTERGLSWRRYAGLVNEFLATVETVLWPDRIVIGGGVSADAARWFHHLRARAELVPAHLANDAGLVGAALWVARDPVGPPDPAGPDMEPVIP